MKMINFSLYIVVYNFIIGMLMIISSEKLGFFAGRLMATHREGAARLVKVGSFTFGMCVAVLMAGTYFTFYVLKLS